MPGEHMYVVMIPTTFKENKSRTNPSVGILKTAVVLRITKNCLKPFPLGQGEFPRSPLPPAPCEPVLALPATTVLLLPPTLSHTDFHVRRGTAC